MACAHVRIPHILGVCPPKTSAFSGNRNITSTAISVILNSKPREIIGIGYGRSGGDTDKALRRSVSKFQSTANPSNEVEEDPEEIISGEWPENYSLLNYDDLRAFLEPHIFKDKMNPYALLGEVMSSTIRTAKADQSLEEINHFFEVVTGLPVIDQQFKCIGVISKKDRKRASNGLSSKVGEVMSTPAITLLPNRTVLDAAALMLKKKIHRIPIVNEEGQVVGIVTRTDIFSALEGLPGQ